MTAPDDDSGITQQTRPTLLFKVRQWDDAVSWAEFHQLYRRLIYGRARRAGLSHADAEDVAQDVFKRVAETIRDFEYDPKRGSFRGWLMRHTQWRIADKFASLVRPENQTARLDPGRAETTAPIEKLPAPQADEDEWDREWQEHVLAAALERVQRQVKPKHFQVLELYVRQRKPVLKVSLELGINPASVYVIGHRLTKLLKAEVENLQKQLA